MITPYYRTVKRLVLLPFRSLPDSKSTWCGPTAHCCLHSSGFTFACGPSLATGVCLLKLKRGGSAGNLDGPSKLKRSDSATGGKAGGTLDDTAVCTAGCTSVGALLPGGSRTRGTGRTLLRADSAGVGVSISYSRAIVTECATALTDSQTPFESSTSLVSG